MPRITRVLETSLYVDDIAASARFYEEVMGLNAISKGDRLVALNAGEGTGSGIEIESEVTWTRGGRSLYFRDPDGHLVELATPGVWEVY